MDLFCIGGFYLVSDGFVDLLGRKYCGLTYLAVPNAWEREGFLSY